MNAKTQTQLETDVRLYKRWLMEAERLRGENGITAFRRALLLVKLFDNDEFRDEVLHRLDDHNVMVIMDELVDDLALTFLELREMLVHYPDQSLWADGKLRTMYDSIAAKPVLEKSEEEPERKRKTATVKEVEQITKSRDLAQSQLSSADQRIVELREENERLRVRVRELESQLAAVIEPALA